MSNCPQGFETPYVLGREGCVECLTKVCLLPAVDHEIGEGYSDLVQQIINRKLVFHDEAKQVLMRFYWDVGEIITRDFLHNKHKAEYGAKLFLQLEKDTDISLTNLYASYKFYVWYPEYDKKPTQCPATTWTKVKALMQAEGDLKVLSQECKHSNKIQVWWCTECKKKVE